MSEFEPYNPDIKKPYPDSWKKITKFKFINNLYLARAKKAIVSGGNREAEYIVAGTYACSCEVDGKNWNIEIPSGMLTDLASVPALARPLVGRVGPHLEAAIVHDFLFVAWQDLDHPHATRNDFKFANEIMRQAMISAKVGFFRRNAIMLAVKSAFAFRAYKKPNPGARFVQVPALPN